MLSLRQLISKHKVFTGILAVIALGGISISSKVAVDNGVTVPTVVRYFSRMHYTGDIQEILSHPQTQHNIKKTFDFSGAMNPGGLAYIHDGVLYFYPLLTDKSKRMAEENAKVLSELEDIISQSVPYHGGDDTIGQLTNGVTELQKDIPAFGSFMGSYKPTLTFIEQAEGYLSLVKKKPAERDLMKETTLIDTLNSERSYHATRKAHDVLSTTAARQRLDEDNIGMSFLDDMHVYVDTVGNDRAMQNSVLESKFLKKVGLYRWLFQKGAPIEYHASFQDELRYYAKNKPQGTFYGEYHCHLPSQIAHEEKKTVPQLILYQEGRSFLVREITKDKDHGWEITNGTVREIRR